MSRQIVLFFTLLLFLLVGCGGGGENELPTLIAVAIVPDGTVPVTFAPALLTMTPTGTERATVTATATPTNTPTATPIPKELLVPPVWEELGAEFLAERPGWRLVVTDDLSNQPADIQLVTGRVSGWLIERPLVLAVPFSLSWPADGLWEGVNQAEAELIVAQGHPLVTIKAWPELRLPWKALRIDGKVAGEEGYPLWESWSLVVAEGNEEVADQLQRWLQERYNPPVIKIAAVGDIMLDRGPAVLLEQGNLTYPFHQFLPYLQEADITVGNFESGLGRLGEPANKSYTFRAPPIAAKALAEAGFDILSLANNHALDYGVDSLLEGMALLREAGVLPVGAGVDDGFARRPVVVERDGIKVAFLSYIDVPQEWNGFDNKSWIAAPNKAGYAWAEPNQIRVDVEAARLLAEQVIVLLHSGFEYQSAPSPAQKEAAMAAIEGGATAVLGHHAHILQGVEFIDEQMIAYGLGNFIFQITGPPETMLLTIWLDQKGIRQIELLPGMILDSGQPRLATRSEAAIIRQHVYELSKQLAK